MVNVPPLIVISGSSGSGKTTLCHMIQKRLGFHFSVSHTTRPKRRTEVDGRDYYFVGEKEFLTMQEREDFLESAQVYGQWYGTSRREIERAQGKGQGVVVDVDVQGALHIKKIIPHAVLIYVCVPSLKVLKERLVNRGSNSMKEIKRRLDLVQQEESCQAFYDHVVVNDNLEKSYEDLVKIIRLSHDQAAKRD